LFFSNSLSALWISSSAFLFYQKIALSAILVISIISIYACECAQIEKISYAHKSILAIHKIMPNIPIELLFTFKLFMPRINPNKPNMPGKTKSAIDSIKFNILAKNDGNVNLKKLLISHKKLFSTINSLASQIKIIKILIHPKIKESGAFFLFIFITLISFN
jgi:hypothetical protein